MLFSEEGSEKSESLITITEAYERGELPAQRVSTFE